MRKENLTWIFEAFAGPQSVGRKVTCALFSFKPYPFKPPSMMDLFTWLSENSRLQDAQSIATHLRQR
jgi:hypothetical protein